LNNLDNVVQLYGDLLFDLCESVLWSSIPAQAVFRSILKDVRKAFHGKRYTDYERAWILRIAFERLKKVSRQSRKVTALEQIQLDSNQNVAARLKQFEIFFHRLSTEDQVLLLLRDKYGLPYPEIASALSLPEGSLKQQRQQTLRTLDGWIWESDSEVKSQTLNCFNWQNRASDYLDGTLTAQAKREADEHLETCEECGTRYKHYRLLVSSIASQPRTALPVAIRKAPFSVPVAKSAAAKVTWIARIARWTHVPWYIRVPAEGLAIVFVVSMAISSGPRLRYLYERKMESSLTEYNEGFDNSDGDAIAPPGTTQDLTQNGTVRVAGAPPTPTASGKATAEAFAPTDVSEDADSEDDEGESDDADTPEIHVGKAEVWRFNMKTDSPRDIRPKITQLLTDLKVPAGTAGIGGIEAPGGIQFDILVSPDVVPQVKQALEKMAPVAPKDAGNSPLSETFTWYKNKSKTPIPPGKTRLVIWLSQI
jgi:DNA-directed RNA polymerase specialized sigma24 family protein